MALIFCLGFAPNCVRSRANMHGRVRGRDSDKDEATLAAMSEALKRKAGMYTKLTALVIKYRREGNRSPEALKLTANILRLNPDYYTLWNYRREILISMHGEGLGLRNELSARTGDISLQESESKIPEETGGEVRDEELKLSQEAITKNPKSYGAWWHRVWVLQRFCCDFDKELQLCTLFLNEDERNFHCWNYRRYVVEAGHIPAELEFRYSTEKIEQNFSNYSALHHRSVFITKLSHGRAAAICTDAVGVKEKAVDEQRNVVAKQAALQVEFAIVHNGVCIEPFDQSFWWYYRFLLQWMMKEIAQQTHAAITQQKQNCTWCKRVLSQQIADMSALMEYHPACKWPVDALVFLLSLRHDVQQLLMQSTHAIQASASEAEAGVGAEAGAEAEADAEIELTEDGQKLPTKTWVYEDLGALLDRLKDLDPARARRYDFLRSR